MAIDLSDFDIEVQDGVVAHLTDALDWRDLQESQDCLITVQYNEIDLGHTSTSLSRGTRLICISSA